MDTHKYPAHKWYMKGKGLNEHLAEVERYANEIRECSMYHPVIVGEWSLGTDGVDDQTEDGSPSDSWLRKYADAQIDAWDESIGGCFWSLRTADGGG